MDRQNRRSQILLVIVVLAAATVITIVAIAGTFSAKSSTDQQSRIITQQVEIITGLKAGVDDLNEVIAGLKATASRTECARKVNADIDQTRWNSISDIVAASGDPAKRILAYQEITHLPNAAEFIDKKCPPPVK